MWPGPSDAVELGGECLRPRGAAVSGPSLGNSVPGACLSSLCHLVPTMTGRGGE